MGIYLPQPLPKDLYSQFNQYRKYFIFLFILFWLMIGVHPIPLPPSYASTIPSNDVSFSIDVKRMPLGKVCKKILNETEYEIIFDQRWQDKAITVKLDNVHLFLGLRRIIKLTGMKNYALVQNKSKIKVFSFESTTSNSLMDELGSKTMLESSQSDVGINLTLAEMKILKEINEEQMENIPKDTIITPPSDSGSELTLGELEALKKAQEKKMENIPKNTVVTPPSDSGKGLTLGELEALKKAQKQKMESMPKNTVVTPPSDSGKGLTLEELEALQKFSK
jgi:hypothetical protein